MIVRNCIAVPGQLRYLPRCPRKALKFLEEACRGYPHGGMTNLYYSLDEVQIALQRSAHREMRRAIVAPGKVPGQRRRATGQARSDVSVCVCS
jgi:hypothetical protein